MKTLHELFTTDRRLIILLSLDEDPGYTMNESVIQSCLDAFGHTVGMDRVRTDLAWLAEQDLITIDEILGVMVAELTGRGADVAQGRTVVPGVKKPRPRG